MPEIVRYIFVGVLVLIVLVGGSYLGAFVINNINRALTGSNKKNKS